MRKRFPMWVRMYKRSTSIDLAKTFTDMVRQKRSEALDSWLETDVCGKQRESLSTFSEGIRQDYEAVR